jgi:hypothetical protein
MHVRLVGGVQCLYCSSTCERSRRGCRCRGDSRSETGIGTSQNPVITVTELLFRYLHNANQEGIMPILMLALIALAAFGLIGLLLVLAVSLEQKKVNPPTPHSGKAA